MLWQLDLHKSLANDRHAIKSNDLCNFAYFSVAVESDLTKKTYYPFIIVEGVRLQYSQKRNGPESISVLYWRK